jgi:putative peptide maturation dehydrogenase
MRQWKDVTNTYRDPDADAADDGLRDVPAPPHFYSAPAASGSQRLPSPVRDSYLYPLLRARASRRAFDRGKELAAEDLSTLLYYCFGCHGYLDAHETVRLLKKTSPSGGSLHPIEVYPLIRAVSGIPPGLYHYSVEHHVLEILKEMSAEEVSDFAFVATAEQAFTRNAHVLFLLTARFDRQFWKYRGHAKAYGVLHMDLGHLSQTVYLVCTDLGLGACITGAINDGNIDEQLGLDGIREGALAVIACGVPLPEGSDEEPVFSPYTPDTLKPYPQLDT